MNCQALVFLFLNVLPWSEAVSRLKPDETSDQRDVDAIYYPHKFGDDSNSSAILSVDLIDLNNFTVCFAFMVDGLPDVADGAEIVTFWQMLASFFPPEQVGFGITIRDGSFAPFRWIRTCFSLDFEKANIVLVVDGKEITKGSLKFETVDGSHTK